MSIITYTIFLNSNIVAQINIENFKISVWKIRISERRHYSLWMKMIFAIEKNPYLQWIFHFFIWTVFEKQSFIASILFFVLQDQMMNSKISFLYICYCYINLYFFPFKLNTSRTTLQYQYTAWPDHGTPDPICLLLFHNHVTRTHQKGHGGSILVHCR